MPPQKLEVGTLSLLYEIRQVKLQGKMDTKSPAAAVFACGEALATVTMMSMINGLLFV